MPSRSPRSLHMSPADARRCEPPRESGSSRSGRQDHSFAEFPAPTTRLVHGRTASAPTGRPTGRPTTPAPSTPSSAGARWNATGLMCRRGRPSPPLQIDVRPRAPLSRRVGPAPRRHRAPPTAGRAALCRSCVNGRTGGQLPAPCRVRRRSCGGRTAAKETATFSTSATRRSTSFFPPRSLRAARTRSTFECVDGFGILLRRPLADVIRRTHDLPAFTDASVDATILFKQRPSGLVELADRACAHDPAARPRRR